MKRSILKTVFFLFGFTIVSIIILFGILYKFNELKSDKEIRYVYGAMTRIFHFYNHGWISEKQVLEEIEKFEVKTVNTPSKIEDIIKNGKLLEKRSLPLAESTLYQYNNEQYFFYVSPKISLMLYHQHDNIKMKLLIFTLFCSFFAIAIFGYMYIAKRLLPLKKLQEEIKNFGEGKKIELIGFEDKNDEISAVGNEFFATVAKLEAIKESRDVFIRNIMHELKTPITKGRILTQMVEEEGSKKRFEGVFSRLESIINEFAIIERLISDAEKLKMGEYLIEDLIDNAIELSMIDEERIEKDIEPFKTNVNYNLFSIAIKNLIDNAYKFSTDKKVKVEAKEGYIKITNKGAKLKYELSKYFEPFFKEEQGGGLGLGLYIVQHILRVHGTQLKYDYKKEESIFTLWLPKFLS